MDSFDGTPTDSTSHKPPPGVPVVQGAGEQRGQLVGPYKLLEVIGEGGFGTVWLAERREPMVQRVALKIIKAGMDTRAVVARFEQERQALAVMDHPHIAKVFDAGATPPTMGGRPYFVMEHVPGDPITEYADRQNLTMRQRLGLFIGVCEAVQHAHHKGIIHRDLKPSNILVTVRDGKAQPKIIDFGIAKAISQTLTDKTIYTEQGHLIGTPEYMSPEQAEMGATDIDTRTDVYSLGVVLYELLSGMLPFDSRSLRAAGYAAICKVLREQDAPKPSTRLSTADDATGKGIARHRVMEREQLARELRRELDWIPLKALRKDRSARYGTPADLARDIQRYLEGQPLEAGPESAGYRLRKFVRRNRGAVAASAAIVVLLMAGIAGVGLTARWALRESADAIAATRVADEKRREADSKTAEAERAKKNAEFEAYIANLAAADASTVANEPSRVRARLDACPLELRGWEWRWLDARSDTSLAVLTGSARASFTADGTQILTAAKDGVVRVWDTATGGQVSSFQCHGPGESVIAISASGGLVVMAHVDHSIGVWDVADAKERFVLRGHTDELCSAMFSPDEKRVVTMSRDGDIRMWDAATRSQLWNAHGIGGWSTGAVFSSDGRRILVRSGGVVLPNIVTVWDAASGERIRAIEAGGSETDLDSAVFTVDGERILAIARNGAVSTWDLATGKVLSQHPGTSVRVQCTSFSADGRRVLKVLEDQTVQVVETGTGREIALLRGHTGGIRSAEFSPDGLQVVTTSDDMTARVWDADTGATLAVLRGHTSEVHTAVFSPGSTRVLTTSFDQTARLWATPRFLQTNGKQSIVGQARCVAINPERTRAVFSSFSVTARIRSTLTGGIVDALFAKDTPYAWATFSPDGSRIATVSMNDELDTWDAKTRAELAAISIARGPIGSRVHASFSPDGARIAAGASGRDACVWDSSTGKVLTTMSGHDDLVIAAMFSPDGSRVATVSADKTARIWDAATGKQLAILRVDAGEIHDVAFSADGTHLVTMDDDHMFVREGRRSAARISEVASGREVSVLSGHGETVTQACFSSDGRRIVAVCFDKVARVWEANTGRELATLAGHEGDLVSAEFSPDGRRILTAAWDKTARVWDALSGRELIVLRGHETRLLAATFSSDGSRIVTADADENTRVWDSISARERNKDQ